MTRTRIAHDANRLRKIAEELAAMEFPVSGEADFDAEVEAIRKRVIWGLRAEAAARER